MQTTIVATLDSFVVQVLKMKVPVVVVVTPPSHEDVDAPLHVKVLAELLMTEALL